MEECDLCIGEHVWEHFLAPKNTAPEISLKLNPDWDGRNAELLTELGYAYEKGTLFEQDYKAAFYLYDAAAKNGDAQAVCNIGWLCQNGLGVKKDSEKAISYYKMAAEKGEEHGLEALERLGVALREEN